MSTQVGFYEAWRDLMRSWGFTVHEAAGWKTRDAAGNRTYLPGKLYIEHHDASSKLSGNWGALNYILSNKLANIVVARDGQITLCAAGAENHAGVGSRNSLGDVPANQANWNSLGNEVANSGSEAYDPRCTRAIIATERAWAIVSGREGQWERIIGHKEWADPAGRKTDPSVDMDQRRRDVAAFQAGAKPAVVEAIPELRFPVYGEIRKAYDRPGVASYLGQPVNHESDAARGGRWQQFERGFIFWHPGVDEARAHVVQGEISELWTAIGREAPLLTGYPVTDEFGTPDGVGRYNHFEFNASIYWSPDTGPQLVTGDIRTKWAAQGWELGSWGYPISGPHEDGGVVSQDFQGGRAFTARTGEVLFTPKGAETPIEPPPVVAPPSEKETLLGLPVPRDSKWRVSSPFGPRTLSGKTSVHRGVDIAAPTGTPLLAMGDGEVTVCRVSGTPKTGFGFVIVIRHEVGGQIVDTVQGHMLPDSVKVKVGDKVTRGQQLAEVGAYGDAKGPHTHAEVAVGGWYEPGSEWVDPAPWLGL